MADCLSQKPQVVPDECTLALNSHMSHYNMVPGGHTVESNYHACNPTGMPLTSPCANEI